jgi:hypothetical protein
MIKTGQIIQDKKQLDALVDYQILWMICEKMSLGQKKQTMQMKRRRKTHKDTDNFVTVGA